MMRKYIIIIIALVIMMILGMSIWYGLTPATKVTLGKNQKVHAGDTVSVTVDVSSKEDVYGIQFNLLFDEEVLEFKDSNTKLSSEWYSGCKYIERGKLRVLLYDTSNFNAAINDVDLYEIFFVVKDKVYARSTMLDISDFRAFDKNGTNISDIKCEGIGLKIK